MSKLKKFILKETVSTVSISTVFAKDAKQAKEYFEKDVNTNTRATNSTTNINVFEMKEEIQQ